MICVDLRNHGRSPWAEDTSYPAMAADLAALIEHRSPGRATLIGHSMGGKAAMWLALSRPELVAGLVVVDMAPTAYSSGFKDIIDALNRLELDRLADRREADTRLADRLPEAAVRNYLLQNLVREGGNWCWRMNLSALSAGLGEIMGFPRAEGLDNPGDTLFVYGADSDYVTGRQLPAIRDHFPRARMRAIRDAGHWVYADQPEAFSRAVSGFLTAGQRH